MQVAVLNKDVKVGLVEEILEWILEWTGGDIWENNILDSQCQGP